MSLGGTAEWPPGWAPTLLEPVAVPTALKPFAPAPEQDSTEDTRWLLESAQAEADGLCEEIRRLARVSATAADATAGGRTSPAADQRLLEEAQLIYCAVEEELERLRQQQEEVLEQRDRMEREQEAELREQRDALRAAHQRLRIAQELGEAEGKARSEADCAKLAAEESLGRLGLEVVRLRGREALLLEEMSAHRNDESQRSKQNEELRSLRASLAAERRRREDAEAMSRERLEEIRQSARSLREVEESAEASRQNNQERWRKQRSLERENRQLRERLQTMQETHSELKSLRSQLEEAQRESQELGQQRSAERNAAAQARRASAAQEEALERAKHQLAVGEDEMRELREAAAQLRQETLAESVASRALTTQLSLSENRIHELCRELVKTETTIDSLQEGAQSLAAIRGEAEQHQSEIKTLEATICRLQSEQLRTLQNESEALRSAELRGESSADEAKRRVAEEGDTQRRRAAELESELRKERGRRDQLKRQLQGLTDERDEALARDWQSQKQGRKLAALEGQCAELKEALAEEQTSRRTVALEGEDLSSQVAKLQAELQLARGEADEMKASLQQSALQAQLVEELRQQKEFLEADRSKLWSELQQQYSAHGEIRQQAQYEQRTAASEVEEQRSQHAMLASELQELRAELRSTHSQRTEAQSQAQLHEQTRGLLASELEELKDELSAKEAQRMAAQFQADAKPADAAELRAELEEARGGARDLASARRKQGILHKQQLDNLREEHRAAMKSLQQQHVQQLTVQQHMLDPNRLSTMVDDLLDEIGSLRRQSDAAGATRVAARREAEALREDLPRMPSSHTQEASAKLQRMRQRLADLEGGEDASASTPRTPATRQPSPARITYTLEPVTSEAAREDGAGLQCEEPEVTMLPEDYEETLVPEECVVMQDRRAASPGFSPQASEAAPRMPPAPPTPIQRQRLHVFQSRLKQVKFEDEHPVKPARLSEAWVVDAQRTSS